MLPCRRTLEQMFEDFAEKPVASGSIAQIHKARLSEGGAENSDYPRGTTVAVKVTFSCSEAPYKVLNTQYIIHNMQYITA